ncbi:MAG: c-type cytochrome [Myxococcota bacterium]
MQMRWMKWVLVAGMGGATSFACADGDSVMYGTGSGGTTTGNGGSSAFGGIDSRGGTREIGTGGHTHAGAPMQSEGGASAAGGNVTTDLGGTAGANHGEGGSSLGGTLNSAGSDAGGTTANDGGRNAAGSAGEAGEGHALNPVVERGRYLVVAVAQCGACHTDNTKPNDFLGGNPNFKSGGVTLAAHNLTPDATGIGSWSDHDIKRAIRDGIDDQGRQLAPAMPYWLFHNLSDPDLSAIVAYLRSIPAVVNVVGDSNAAAAPVAVLSASAFPNTSLSSGDDNYESARRGRYLLSSAARCVSCHSVSSGGVPAPAFSGRPPSTSGNVYPPNITPDATGIAGWSAADVASVLLTSLAKGTTTPICSMPRYAALTPEDALAIGNYLTTIPAVVNASADRTKLPACP